MYYYQVGGFGSHTFQWFKHDTRTLADCVFYALSPQAALYGDDKMDAVELVLGILDTGASYLLVSESQMDTVLQTRKMLGRPRGPRHASDYASISPITFCSASELHTKLKTYEQNAKKKKNGRGLGQDTSPANKMFDQYNPARAAFEHQRVLWTAIQNPIDINKFGLCELPYWISSTSLVALTLQIWTKESIEKQRKDPTILSLELASVRCIAFREREDYASNISSTIRVKIKEHSLMSNGPYMSRNDMTLEMVNKAELGKRLNDFFASIDSKYALLLVYDAEQTLSALRKLGIDVISYQEGIGILFYGQNRRPEDSASCFSDSGNYRKQNYPGDRSSRRGASDSKPEPRKRSRSPWRHPYHERPRSPLHESKDSKSQLAPKKEDALEEGEGEEEEEEEEDTEASPPAKVHVLDVRALFLAVSRLESRGVKSLRDLAGRLRIPEDPNGNECRLLIEAWKSMASGKAIDEQHAERASAGAFTGPPSDLRPIAGLALPAGSDEEIDPNDIVVNPDGQQRPLTVVGGGLRPLTDDYDSDDSDF